MSISHLIEYIRVTRSCIRNHNITTAQPVLNKRHYVTIVLDLVGALYDTTQAFTYIAHSKDIDIIELTRERHRHKDLGLLRPRGLLNCFRLNLALGCRKRCCFTTNSLTEVSNFKQLDSMRLASLTCRQGEASSGNNHSSVNFPTLLEEVI